MERRYSSVTNHSTTVAPRGAMATEAQALLDLYHTDLQSLQDVPSFFEHIMVPEFDPIGLDPTQPPPTLTALMPEADWFGAVDLFGSEFTPAVDQTYEAQQVLNEFFTSTGAPKPVETQTQTAQGADGDDAARRRHAIFQRSPWSVSFGERRSYMGADNIPGYGFLIRTSMPLASIMDRSSTNGTWISPLHPTSLVRPASQFQTIFRPRRVIKSFSSSRRRPKARFRSHHFLQQSAWTSSSRWGSRSGPRLMRGYILLPFAAKLHGQSF